LHEFSANILHTDSLKSLHEEDVTAEFGLNVVVVVLGVGGIVGQALHVLGQA
jgi:hypothetical protein